MAKRISKITKGISRKFNIAKFETLMVTVEYDEEIEWDDTDINTRRGKTQKVTQELLSDFNKTVDDVFKELELTVKNAYVESAGDKNTVSASKAGLNLGDKL